jgi:O-acetyl-ADP-ribose deacetylase (regulator of RNase III)
VFGTGNLEYPWDEVANTMIDTINKYGRMHYDTTIREVKIVLFDKDIKSIQVNIV